MKQHAYSWLNYIPALLAGFTASALVVAFAMGYLPLTGIFFIDTVQTTVMFIDNNWLMAFYIGEKALLAFFTVSTASYWAPKFISIFDIEGLREKYYLRRENRELEKEVTHLKLKTARLDGRIDAISNMTSSDPSLSNRARCVKPR